MQELNIQISRYIPTRLSKGYRLGEICPLSKGTSLQKGYIGPDGIQRGGNSTGDPTLNTALILSEYGEILAIHPDDPTAAILKRENVLKTLLVGQITILCGPDLNQQILDVEGQLTITNFQEP